MYYYTFKDDSELTRDNVAKFLERLGYKKSRFSCDIKIAKGIGLSFHHIDSECNLVKEKEYIFLSEDMMSKNPRIGWVEPYRKEVKELIHFYNVCRELA